MQSTAVILVFVIAFRIREFCINCVIAGTSCEYKKIMLNKRVENSFATLVLAP